MTIHTDESSRPVFEFFDNALAGATPDVLGLWATSPLSPKETVAFSAGAGRVSEIPPETPVWRVNLPADSNLAATRLKAGEITLESSQKVMKDVPGRLDAIMTTHSAAASFDISPEGKQFAEPERELLLLLNGIQAGRSPVSFGLGEKFTGGWKQASDQFGAFVEQLLKSVAHYVWVETCVQEQCLGRTSVSLTGDMSTVWQQKLNPKHVKLHQQSLALVLTSRVQLLQTLSMAISAAVQLSVLLAAPGSAILALPAVWRCINRILKELKIED